MSTFRAISDADLEKLRAEFKGEIRTDRSILLMYATDASVYREIPSAVVYPKDMPDVRALISFAVKMQVPLIPRATGTSLAGQVVGKGIVADVTRHMNKVLEINTKERWVRVEPGVVLDELNQILEPKGLFFAPETSTSNRCTIGGMVGNNACGAHSLVYGSTRDHLLEVKAVLGGGREVLFKALNENEFQEKCKLEGQEGNLYRTVRELFSDEAAKKNIRNQFPHPEIKRRNTSYALDLLLDCKPFSDTGTPFNFCKLIAGSEGTLCFMTELKLNLLPIEPKEKALLCVHCNSLDEAFRGNLIALKQHPVAIELMDDVILKLSELNLTQRKNRFFLQGLPKALLIIELAEDSRDEIERKAKIIEADFREAGCGYHFPLVFGPDTQKIWALRRAGLGILANMKGDAKPVSVIEDTSVRPQDLAAYLKDIQEMLQGLGLQCVYHAHIATGELHLRPVLNLKTTEGVALFRQVAEATANIVKKYRGSLSGEHGDGRLRAEFIPLVIGNENYELLKKIKKAWDPANILNPGKIVLPQEMTAHLRQKTDQTIRKIETVFDFSDSEGILRAAEQCNGVGDCRKSHLMGGTMCPSYMVSKNESDTTRARANILREFLTHSTKNDPFDHREIQEVMELCISCKACKSECPSSVDMARLKAEFQQHWYDKHGIKLKTRLVANFARINEMGTYMPILYNILLSNRLTSGICKKILGFAPQRSLPELANETLRSWFERQTFTQRAFPNGKVYLFADEFTNYNDVGVGIKAIKLLHRLGYEVVIPQHNQSGRVFISKGLIRKAQKFAIENVNVLSKLISERTPLIGIEPSAILTFRDEYPDLVGVELKGIAQKMAVHCLQFDEFIMREAAKGNIISDQFTNRKQLIRLHGHCHQKAISTSGPAKEMLSLPLNYTVDEIKSGCCGMAGTFGYEKEHYEFSQKIGELVLFPEVRNTPSETLIAAPGTSCRQQIFDATGKRALHPIEVLHDAMDWME